MRCCDFSIRKTKYLKRSITCDYNWGIDARHGSSGDSKEEALELLVEGIYDLHDRHEHDHTRQQKNAEKRYGTRRSINA